MPKVFRYNSSGTWSEIKNIYRYAGSSTWQKIKKAYRYAGSGNWALVFSSQDAPIQDYAPTLTGNAQAGTSLTATSGSYDSYFSLVTRIAYSTTDASFINSTTGSTSSSFPTSVRTSPYSVTNSDANSTSLYYAAVDRVEYSGNGKYYFYYGTPILSFIQPTVTTPTLSSATTSGFTVSWTSGPSSYHTSDVLIYDSSQQLIATYTSQTSPYVWNGGSEGTKYYAKVKVTSTDSSGTNVTSSFSSSITTDTTPTLSSPTNLIVYTHDPRITSNNFVASWSAVSGATSYRYSIYDNTNGVYLHSNLTTSSTQTTTLSIGEKRQIIVYVRAEAAGYNPSSYSQIYYDCGPIPIVPTSFDIYTYAINGTYIFFTHSGGSGHGVYLRADMFNAAHTDAAFNSEQYEDYATGISNMSPATTYTYFASSPGSVYNMRLHSYTTGRLYGLNNKYLTTSYTNFYYIRSLVPAASTVTSLTITDSTIGQIVPGTITFSFKVTSNIINTHFYEVDLYKYSGNTYVSTQRYEFFTVNGRTAGNQGLPGSFNGWLPGGDSASPTIALTVSGCQPGYRYIVNAFPFGVAYDSGTGFYYKYGIGAYVTEITI